MSKIRVFLADDRAMLRAGLRALLLSQEDMEIVGDGACSLNTFALITATSPHVLVSAIPSPMRPAAPTLQQLRSAAANLQLLVMADQPDATAARRARLAGALGFLSLNGPETELPRAIRAVARGERYLDPVLVDAPEMVDRDPSGSLRRLSERERQVLELLSLGFTNQQIADRLFLSVKTAETYRARIGRKLQLRDRAGFIRFGLENGLLTPEALAHEPQPAHQNNVG